MLVPSPFHQRLPAVGCGAGKSASKAEPPLSLLEGVKVEAGVFVPADPTAPVSSCPSIVPQHKLIRFLATSRRSSCRFGRSRSNGP